MSFVQGSHIVTNLTSHDRTPALTQRHMTSVIWRGGEAVGIAPPYSIVYRLTIEYLTITTIILIFCCYVV